VSRLIQHPRGLNPAGRRQPIALDGASTGQQRGREPAHRPMLPAMSGAGQAALLYVIVSRICTPSASAMLWSRSSPTPL
jgi:hypothetical protein